jgi:hypothetical protein
MKTRNGISTISCILGERKYNKEDNLLKMIFEWK